VVAKAKAKLIHIKLQKFRQYFRPWHIFVLVQDTVNSLRNEMGVRLHFATVYVAVEIRQIRHILGTAGRCHVRRVYTPRPALRAAG
jgi:hypothetical protein